MVATARVRRGLVGIGVVAAGTAMVVSGAALPASAASGDVVKRGTCTQGSEWKLKLSPDNGRIETEFEVDSNKVGQTWTVKVFRNGGRVVSTTAVTKAPSGSFTVRRLLANPAGVDTIRAVATNPVTGEVCRGSASV